MGDGGTQTAETGEQESAESMLDRVTGDEEGLFGIRPIWFSIAFYGFLFVWALYILRETLAFTRFEDYFFPYILLAAIMILVPFRLLMVLFPDVVHRIHPQEEVTKTSAEDELKEQIEEVAKGQSTRPKDEKEKYEIYMIAWVIVLPFMMYFMGMGWAMLIFVFGFTWFFMRDVKVAVLTTIAVAIFTVVLFMAILDIIVWTGTLGLPDPLVYLEDLLF